MASRAIGAMGLSRVAALLLLAAECLRSIALLSCLGISDNPACAQRRAFAGRQCACMPITHRSFRKLAATSPPHTPLLGLTRHAIHGKRYLVPGTCPNGCIISPSHPCIGSKATYMASPTECPTF